MDFFYLVNLPAQVKSISTEKHLTNHLKLSDPDMWLISSQMNSIKWRALGRSLGLEEAILVNLDDAHKGQGTRECAYQMLLEWKVNDCKCYKCKTVITRV